MFKKLSFIWLLVLASFGANANYAPLISNKASISVVSTYVDSPTIQNGFASELVSFSDIDYRFPSVDDSGRLYYGDIAQNIINVLNTDPAGKLTHKQELYVMHTVGGLRHVWDKMKAVYGFAGGTAFKHKWNWKDMRDTDEAFRITWGGTITHSSNGIKGSGLSNSYGDTNLNASLVLTQNNTSVSSYVTGAGTGIDVGAGAGNTSSRLLLITRFVTNSFYLSDHYSDVLGGRIFVSPPNNDGYFITNRTSSSHLSAYHNGNLFSINSSSSSIGTLPNNNFKLFNWDGVTSNLLGNRQIKFASIGEGLTDQEAITLSNNITFAQKFR